MAQHNFKWWRLILIFSVGLMNVKWHQTLGHANLMGLTIQPLVSSGSTSTKTEVLQQANLGFC